MQISWKNKPRKDNNIRKNEKIKENENQHS